MARNRRRGGGIAILTRSNHKVIKKKCSVFDPFELIDVNIRTGKELIHLLAIYRPPYTGAHKFTVKQFCAEFKTLLECVGIARSPDHRQ